MKVPAISKTYGIRKVLDLPAFEIPEGQITAVAGSNGSGKSCIAKILAGIELSDQKTGISPDITVGYMPQKSYAFRMSTERNILLNGGDKDRFAYLMNALNLEHLCRHPAKKLSGGETAKMALARLLMRSYHLLILDEPTAAMDMESTLAAEDLIRSCRKETGCAVLLITHSIQQARRIADRMIYLHEGCLIEQGETEQLLNRPLKDETRRFLEFYGV